MKLTYGYNEKTLHSLYHLLEEESDNGLSRGELEQIKAMQAETISLIESMLETMREDKALEILQKYSYSVKSIIHEPK
jgi:hypothetical protein